MQHSDRAGLALELAVFAAEGLYCRPSGTEERRKDRLCVAQGLGPQFARKREGEQEVLGRHLQAALAFGPAFALMVLIVRAQPVPALMQDQPLFGAIGTGGQ
jgi:hypothetical protein